MNKHSEMNKETTLLLGIHGISFPRSSMHLKELHFWVKLKRGRTVDSASDTKTSLCTRAGPQQFRAA